MEQQSEQKSSLDGRRGNDKGRLKKGGKDPAGTANKPKHEGKAAAGYNWFAVVNTKENSVVHVDTFLEHAKAVIRLRFLPDEGKAWRDAHPEYKSPLVPAAAYESMLEHYIIVKCNVNLSEEIVWKGESEKTEVVLLGTTTLKRMVDAVYGEASLPNNHATYSECGNARMDVEADRSRWDETVYVYYHPKENATIMTNIEGDFSGVAGSSAGFEGKVTLSDLAK